MHLIGNSVAVPVVKMLTKSVVETGVFADEDWNGRMPTYNETKIGRIKEIIEEPQLTFNF